VNGLMAPATRRGRRRPESSFRAPGAGGCCADQAARPADLQFLADLLLMPDFIPVLG
jgi:hypothetical protein